MFSLPASEYRKRISRLHELMAVKRMDAVYLSGSTAFNYFAGYTYISTERPAALVFTSSGKVYFFGPVMEREHVFSQTAFVDEARTYFDYPGETHPLKLFAQWLRELGLSGRRLGVDNPSLYSSSWGFRGVPVSELLPEFELVNVAADVYAMRVVKSENELALIRESVTWGNLAHVLLQEYSSPGEYDFAVSARASIEASLIMKKTLGPGFKPTTGPLPALAGFRGQVGEHSAFPHSLSVERPMKEGDVLVTGASADVGGYHSELERNLFLGEPTQKVAAYHKVMLGMQEAAIAAVRAGAKCSEVDLAARRFAVENGVENLLLHHTGHGMGLEGHESPFFDLGDETVIQPGMVFSVEPGIYVPGLGGFRHSDTVIVHEDYVEIVTHYPRSTEDLVVKS